MVHAVERSGLVLSQPNRRPTTRHPDENIAVYNASPHAAPQYGLAWLRSYDETNDRWNVWRPKYPGISLLCVLTDAVAAGAVGSAWTLRGVPHRLLCNAYASLSPGDRIGAQEDSWYGAAQELGPFEMVRTVAAAERPAGLPAGVGLVGAEIVGSDSGVIYCIDGSIDKTFRVILLSSSYEGSFSNGKLTVRPAGAGSAAVAETLIFPHPLIVILDGNAYACAAIDLEDSNIATQDSKSVIDWIAGTGDLGEDILRVGSASGSGSGAGSGS